MLVKMNLYNYTTIHRLGTGRNRLNMHLHRIGLQNSDLCDFCEEPRTAKHFYLIV